LCVKNPVDLRYVKCYTKLNLHPLPHNKQLPHMTAAFDTVTHSILLQRLQSTFDICDIDYRWLQSYKVINMPS